jgi:acetyltransferase
MHPYPAEWENEAALRDGTRVRVRPIKGEDAALYPTFMAAESFQDARRRFFAAISGLSRETIARLTHVDYDRTMAFIALDAADGKMLGVVRLHRLEAPDTAEYAIIVRSDFKGRGLGRILMQRMIEWAKAARIGTITALVLADNAEMLKLCEELGFTVGDYQPDRDIKRVTLQLAGLPAP